MEINYTGDENMFREIKIAYLNADDILQNKNGVRKEYDPKELEALAGSIKSCGILNPVTVRKCGKKYMLIAGERRIRAARLAGLNKIPAVVYGNIKEDTADLCAICENLQRKNISYIDEGEAYKRIIMKRGMSIKELAGKLGEDEKTTADKVRIASFSEDIKNNIKEKNLTPEQAKLLLMLETDEEREEALSCEDSAKLKTVVLDMIHEKTKPKSETIRKQIVKNAKVYENTINAAVKMIKKAGNNATETHTETDEYIEYTIKIAK